MSLFNRRIAIQKILAGLAPIPFLHQFSQLSFLKFSPYYCVTYSCKKNTEEVSYKVRRHAWSDTNKIAAISKRYSENGQLLHFAFLESDSTLSWTYYFLDQKSFKQWNNEVFHSNAFNSNKVESDFSFTIKKFATYNLPKSNLNT